MDGFVADYISAFTAERPAAGLRRVRADHDGLRALAGTGHLGAGPRLRDLRPLVLRGAVADVPQPVVLPRGHLVRVSWSTWSPPRPSRCTTRRDDLRAARGPGPDLAGLLRPAEPPLADRHHPRARGCRTVRDKLLQHRPVPGGRGDRAAADLLVHRAQPAVRPQRHAPGLRRPVPRRGPRPAVLAAGRRGAAGEDLQRDPLLSVADRVERLQHAARGHLRRARRHLRPRSAAGRAAPGPDGSGRADGLPVRPFRACGCPPSRSRRGSRSRPWSTTSTGTRR